MQSNSLHQAIVLRDRHRLQEAEALILTYLASEPDDPNAHYELAITRMQMEKREKDALESINNAIGQAPDYSLFQSIKSLILGSLKKHSDALKVAELAISLDSGSALAWVAKSRALGGKDKWKDAEQAVRKALEIEPDDEDANNLLSLYLRLQGKTQEADRYTDIQLSQDAENPIALANRGWTKIHQGKHQEAEELFLSALRIKPDEEYAREGLRESYKTRNPLYRLYLKWAFFMQRFEGSSQVFIIIGMVIAMKLGRQFLNQIHPGLAIALTVTYMLFIFWVWLASGLGHFLLLIDNKARLSLRKREIWDGILVGGSFCSGITLMLLGIIPPLTILTYLGISLIVASLPLSLVALNDSHAGKFVFAFIGSCIILLGAADSFQAMTSVDNTGFIGLGILLGLVSTWLALIPGLKS